MMDGDTHTEPHNFMFGPVKCSTHTIADLLEEVKNLRSDPSLSPRVINCINAHIFNMAWGNRLLAQMINKSRVVTADGMSIVWASRLFGEKLQERCNATEAFRSFMLDSSFPPSRAILVGGTEDVVSSAAATIQRTCHHMQVVEAISGYMPDEWYEPFFQNTEPVDYIFLGMGTPKSERLAQVIAKARPEAIVWHIGGGTILFLSGTLSEAPAWMRRTGLQWLHRLLLEPRRMWQRYLIGNLLFLFRCIKACIK